MFSSINLKAILFGVLSIIFIGLLFYIKILKSDIRDLEKELTIRDQNNLILSSTIKDQNEAIKKLKVDNSSVIDKFNDISSKYNDIRYREESIEKISKDNNISSNEARLILERDKIQKGLDEFFKDK